ncbi:uncharacterized protein LOC117171875 isoform X2 [Belonocnema kinseyi]|uniref:uncharacterized protein LOC117171875 isoform X2 n=1 Tax=Belonocnema kinseyi TaxID=2817044 RepID=UPI00143CDA5D|nr:uncharacterized protein LOC117171875 isoform X2 [Belonocnema kinseyi]
MAANILTLIGSRQGRRKQVFKGIPDLDSETRFCPDLDSETYIKIEPKVYEEEVSENGFVGFDNTATRIPSTTDIGALNLWTTKATSCLIAQYKKYKAHVGQTTKMRSLREMFEMISFEMQKYGFYFSAQKCENKWRVLERKYKNLVFREKLKKPGRMRHYGHWEHRRALDEIFDEQKQHMYLDESDFPPPSGSAKIAAMMMPQLTQNGNIANNGTSTQSSIGNNNSHPESNNAYSKRTENLADQSGIIKTFLANFVDEMTKNFALAERNNERRHQEDLAMRQSELEVQKKILRMKEKKLELQKINMMAAAQNLGLNL